MESSKDISELMLRELRWIKWFSGLIAVCFVLIIGLLSWVAWDLSDDSLAGEEPAVAFSEQVTKLLEAGREAEVLKLADERETRYPKDPYVYWYRGLAQHQLGHLDESLKSIRRAHELTPSWRESVTAPFIKAVEDELAAKH